MSWRCYILLHIIDLRKKVLCSTSAGEMRPRKVLNCANEPFLCDRCRDSKTTYINAISVNTFWYSLQTRHYMLKWFHLEEGDWVQTLKFFSVKAVTVVTVVINKFSWYYLLDTLWSLTLSDVVLVITADGK